MGFDEVSKVATCLSLSLEIFKYSNPENKITKAKITRSSIKLNVIFETFQVRALLDKNDKIIDGDNENEILVKDEWVFERKVNDNNPNWTLVETKSN